MRYFVLLVGVIQNHLPYMISPDSSLLRKCEQGHLFRNLLQPVCKALKNVNTAGLVPLVKPSESISV